MKVPLPQAQNARVLADWVTTSLREAILNGYFAPGEKLDQDQIAEELKISRTPVREAISRLESEGFIEVRPHRGAFMAMVSQQDIREVYEIRRLIEAEAVRQATPLIPESVLDELDRSLTETQVQFDSGDTTKHFASDIYYHKTILDFTPNRLLKEVLDGLTNRISMVRSFAQSRPGPHLVESLQEHRAILQAMRQRDPEQAAGLMRLHLEKSALRVQELAQEPMGV
ncbi:MAG: GntR family transcriptional regulator [Chloroflexi bacterium]|nr:GntR family transcriptional regulator [Chloroflexota bacterium]